MTILERAAVLMAERNGRSPSFDASLTCVALATDEALALVARKAAFAAFVGMPGTSGAKGANALLEMAGLSLRVQNGMSQAETISRATEQAREAGLL